MRTRSLLFFLFAIILGHVLTSSKRDPNNPPVARTGAPSETTCAASGCHSGGSFVGTVSISGIPDTVLASQVYSITLTHASNAVRSGFELVCLDANNANCGTLATASGVSVGTSSNGATSGRKYARQSSPHNLSGGATTWTFNWTAPASLSTDSLTFYYASLAANSNGQKSGDNVFLGSQSAKFATQQSVGIQPIDAQSGIHVYPNVTRSQVFVELPQNNQHAQLTLFDLNGKRLIQQTFDAETFIELNTLPNGIYVLSIQLNGQIYTQKITLQK